MQQDQANRRRLNLVLRAVIEIALLIFFFCLVRLIWEFTAANERGMAFALKDILTRTNFLIAIVSALIGYVVYLLKPKLNQTSTPPDSCSLGHETWESRPGESHAEALAELYVSLSTHTAAIMEPCYVPPGHRKCADRFRASCQ